jgi:hypothetical protein
VILLVEIHEKNNKIALFRKNESEDDRSSRTRWAYAWNRISELSDRIFRKEIEQLLLHETQQRIALESQIKELKKALEKSHQVCESLKV